MQRLNPAVDGLVNRTYFWVHTARIDGSRARTSHKILPSVLGSARFYHAYQSAVLAFESIFVFSKFVFFKINISVKKNHWAHTLFWPHSFVARRFVALSFRPSWGQFSCTIFVLYAHIKLPISSISSLAKFLLASKPCSCLYFQSEKSLRTSITSHVQEIICKIGQSFTKSFYRIHVFTVFQSC